jgi:acyl-CoA thioester hydrolase
MTNASENKGEKPEPLALHTESVRPEWIDYNGHMNVAYYMLAFDHATDALLDHLDLGDAYRRRSGHSNFVVEAHVTYARELAEGDGMRFTTQILAADAKRLHVLHRMVTDEGDLSATCELMILNVDMATRRAAPMPDEARERAEKAALAHAHLPRPEEAGRIISLPG